MGIFSKRKKKDELVLILDIGSSSVGGALVLLQSSGAPKIIYSVREPIILEAELEIDRFLSLTIKSLQSVVAKICAKRQGAPSRVFCVLSSPWYSSQTRLVRLEKNSPFLFTEKLADSLIAKETALFEEEYLTHGVHLGDKLKPIELKNMSTVLNGYKTTSPYNQKAKELEMTIFTSIAEESILTKTEEAINVHFHSPKIRYSSFTLASFTVARDLFVNQDNFLLVNIGGEVTDISMVKKDIIKDSISYPAGRNFLVREIAKEVNCTLEEAKSYLSLYKDGHMPENSMQKVEVAINKARMNWLKKFQEAISNLTNDISIPANIFITVDQDLIDFFAEIIKTEQFTQYTLTESKFKVSFLGTDTLHGIAVFDENATRDAFLIIESIYINRFLR